MRLLKFLPAFAALSWLVHVGYRAGIDQGLRFSWDAFDSDDWDDDDEPFSWVDFDDEGEPTLFPDKPEPFWPTERQGSRSW